MTFTYTYRSSDGQRHSAEIEAENRDDAFARVRRELGIKPIRVVAADGSKANGEEAAGRRFPKWGVVLVVLVVLGVLALAVWWQAMAGARDARPYQVMTPQGPVTLSVATPLPRQRIPGDRQRIENFPTNLFTHVAEAYLARYAEPGRSVARDSWPVARGFERVDCEGDFKAALREPIRIASTDYTEWVDLKRIVTGMKREMQAYLAGGGTAEGYLAELEKRQKLEISYRERAEQRLAELLKGQNARQSAYDYWLKANAQLKSMGIYELPLPDDLRTYQMGMEIED